MPIRSKRRFERHAEPLARVIKLKPDHPAVVEGRTLFPHTVRSPSRDEWVLKSGEHSSKLGSHVSKGKWRGMPIFTLSLEERATCPRSCGHWQSCYGNHMQWPTSVRWRHGPELIRSLTTELECLSLRHEYGFAVRVHNLGDFYSVGYVRQWAKWLDQFEPLHVFGYTAWARGSRIGDAVIALRDAQWERFAIRLSNSPDDEKSANTVWEHPTGPVIEQGIVCPAQTGRAGSCGSCGLCWSTARNIAFLAH